MPHFPTWMLLLAFGLSSTFSFAQSDKWTVKDIIGQERLSSPVFSPDGKKVAWIKRRASYKKDRFVTDLYLTYLDRMEKDEYLTLRLTQGDQGASNPIFDPKGNKLYFLSGRKGGKTLWALHLMGGEAVAVDSFPNGLSQVQLYNDSTLVFVAQEGPSLYEQTLKKKKDNVVVVEDQAHLKATRVFLYNLKQKTRTRITDNTYPLMGYSFSKDGKWLITTHRLSHHYASDGKPTPTHYLWDLNTKFQRKEILKEGVHAPGNYQFTADSKGFYFSSDITSSPEWRGAGKAILHYMDLATMEHQEVPLDWDWGLSGGYMVVKNDVLVSLAQGTTRGLAFFQKNDESWKKYPVDAGEYTDHISPVKWDQQYQQLIYTHSTASTPISYHLTTPNLKGEKWGIEKGKELVALNAHLKKKPKAKTEAVSWTGALGEEVDGMLYYPQPYEEGKAYPLMVAIHGGPTGSDTDTWSDRWSYPHNLITQEGCFILKPNYHGSGNHGQAWAESIKQHYYEYEIPDILAGIDMLAEKGMVNKDSLAVMGWSNGAIIATMLTVQHPDMFLAATPGAGDVNWTSDFGTCRFGVTFDQYYFGGAPWDDTNGKPWNEAYLQKSPLFEMEKVKTPTLIFHGSEDRAVPRDQGWEYYRALQQIGQTPVRFLWFPGQPHGLQKLTHQMRKVEEEMKWFQQHFFGRVKAENEAVKKDSPLMLAISEAKISKVGSRYGVAMGKLLLPEVVADKKAGAQIGRFEITHAQYKSFDRKHAIPEGKENFPIQGLNIQQAQAYVAWLSEKTGKSYRLPNAKEAKAWHKMARKQARKQNTLAYWAGYNITRDEVPMLLTKIQAEKASLVREVGSFPVEKSGEAKVYDLSGNVAEWCQDGTTYGYGAYDWVDPSDNQHQPEPAQVGFRVVLDKP